MLIRDTTRSNFRQHCRGNVVSAPASQRGVTLLITLIVLVIMTLAAISLVRSVDTTNVIAGNLAFRQTTTLSGDYGTEQAVHWLEQNTGLLTNSQPGMAYINHFQDPTPGQTWDDWWINIVGSYYFTLPPDAAGNTVAYTIERMCKVPPGLPPDCQVSEVQIPDGSSVTSGSQNLITVTQTYYRITSRITGPRNSVTYVQTLVAL